MGRLRRYSLTISVVLLLTAVFLPWVNFTPPKHREKHLERIARNVSTENWPLVSTTLDAIGIESQTYSADDLRQYFLTNETEGVLKLVEQRQRLWLWHYSYPGTAWKAKSLVVIYLITLVTNGLRLSANAQIPKKLTLLLFSICCLVFILNLPYLDTFGYPTDSVWGALDFYLGGKVAPLPRLLVPLGCGLGIYSSLQTQERLDHQNEYDDDLALYNSLT